MVPKTRANHDSQIGESQLESGRKLPRVAYVRTVKTSSEATAVHIVVSWRKGYRSIEHLGSAHDDVELAALKTVAAERLAAGQIELDLGLSSGVEPGTLPILSSQMTGSVDSR